MRSFLLCVVLSFTLHLCYFSGVFAQITFTREWVAGGGKRSGGVSHNTLDMAALLPILENNKDILGCRSAWPAIDLLMEIEKQREERCSSGAAQKKSIMLLRKANEKYSKIFPKDDSLIMSGSNFPQFEEDSNTPRKIQLQNR